MRHEQRPSSKTIMEQAADPPTNPNVGVALAIVAAATALLLATASLSMADEVDPLTTLKVEKAVLEKRLKEINSQIDSIEKGHEIILLGMTLIDSTEELMRDYGLPLEHPRPIVVKIQDRSFFASGMEPTQRCAFRIVENPANGFLFNKEKSTSHHPESVRELADAIVASTVTPEEYQKIFDRTAQAARDRAETMKDKPAERERLLRIADSKIAEDEVGKYICRVVYNYPGHKGTMTTCIRMTKADLDKLREFLKN